MTFENPQLDIVTRNLQEFIGVDKLDKCLTKNGLINLYWGTAPTGRPHIAYFLPMTKLADFLKAGCQVTVLFANLHAYLDNMKAPWELLQKRTEYYEILIKGMLKSLQVPLDKLKFIRGTDYQLSESYTSYVYRIIALTTAHDAAKAGCEVVKQTSDPKLSGIIYPLLQAIDEEFLGVDVQFGGVDQRKIFTYAEKYLPNLGFAKRAHLMNPMIPGLTGGKMSASEENSKIDLLDNHESISAKLRSVNFSSSNETKPTAETNGVLAFIKFVILPIKDQLKIDELEKYNNINEIEHDFQEGIIDENLLKSVVEKGLWLLMQNLRDEFRLADRVNLDQEAYPRSESEEAVVMKKDDTLKSVGRSVLDCTNEWTEALKRCEFLDTCKSASEGRVEDGKRPKVMWSVRASGEPHIGYLVPIKTLAELSNNGWSVSVLVEDIGAHLFSHHTLNKPAWNLIKHRVALYKEFINSAFRLFGGDFEHFEIVIGSDFQLTQEYALLLYQSFSHVTERESHQLATEMLIGNSKTEDTVSDLSSVIYPCVTALDTIFLRPTVRLFGTAPYLSSLLSFTRSLTTYLQMPFSSSIPLFLVHPIILSLDSSPVMKCPKIAPKTAPKDNTSISVFDNFETISRKLKKAFFDPKNLSTDASLNILQLLIWPILSHRNEAFIVKRSEQNGGDVPFNSIEEIKQQLINDLMHPGDIKSALVEYLNQLLIDPLKSNEAALLFDQAFPPDSNSKNKVKKISSKAFNPNRIDIRLMRVKSITYQSGNYQIQMETPGTAAGVYILERQINIISLTPGDTVLAAVSPSQEDNLSKRVVGVLCTVDGRPIQVDKRCLRPNVTFNRHEPVVPHLKENDHSIIVEQIAKNCVINSRGQLEWKEDGSVAYDIDFCGQNRSTSIAVVC